MLKDIQMYLPKRRKMTGRPPSIGTVGVESRYEWPYTIEHINSKSKRKLMGLAMERAVVFFFKNFCYTFAGKKFIQKNGGPIGARLTLALAKCGE